MANFAISSGDYIRPYRSMTAPETRALPESTAQSYILGDVLEQDTQVSTSSHRLRQAIRSASTITSTAIVGVAAEGASSVTDTKRIFWTASRNNEFWGRTINGLLASTNLGAGYGLVRDSTRNVCLVDLGNGVSTSQRVVITEFIDALADSGGAVVFRFGTPRGAMSTNTFGLGF